MADINKVILVGRLTRNAEHSYTQKGNYSLLKFSIAVNRRRKQGEQWVEEPSFFDVTCFGPQGQAIANYMYKGRQVAIEGQLRQDRWEQDGTKRSKVYVETSYVQLIGSGKQGNNQSEGEMSGKSSHGSDGGNEWNPPSPSGSIGKNDKEPPSDFSNFEDDIPF